MFQGLCGQIPGGASSLAPYAKDVVLNIHILGTEIELTMFEGFDAGHFFCKAMGRPSVID